MGAILLGLTLAFDAAAQALYRPVPNFSALDQDGMPVSVHDFAGQVLVLHFCALYCGPCRNYAGSLPGARSTLDAAVGPENYAFLEVLLSGGDGAPSTQADAQAWTAFTGPGLSVMHAAGMDGSEIRTAFSDFGLNATPSFVVIDPGLRVVAVDDISGTQFDLPQAVQDALTAWQTPTPPSGQDDVYEVTPGEFLQVDAASGVLANDFDANGDMLTAAKLTDPAAGLLNLNPDGSFEFDAPGDFTGGSFTYEATAADGSTGTVTVSLEVDDGVIAVDDFYDVPGDRAFGSTYVPLNGSSPLVFDNDILVGGGTLEVEAFAGADGVFVTELGNAIPTTLGLVRMSSAGQFFYQPYNGERGEDSFQYRVRNTASGATDTATVNLFVSERPTIGEPGFDYVPGERTEFFDPLLESVFPSFIQWPDFYDPISPTGRRLTIYVLVPPEHGAIDFESNGSFAYTPFTDSPEGDQFWVQATDGLTLSDPRRVFLQPTRRVIARNDAYGVANAEDTLVVPAGSGVLQNDVDPLARAFEVLGYGFDLDYFSEPGQPLELPSGATLTIETDGALTYVPPPGVQVPFTDRFFYDVGQAGGIDGFTSAAVLVTVGGDANLPPVADAGGPYLAAGGATIDLDGSGSSDPDMGVLTYAWSASAGSFDDATSVTPMYTAPNETRPVVLTLTVTDDLGAEATDQVEILVSGEGVFDELFGGGFED